MAVQQVTIVDYDVGNLKSVHRAFTAVGASVCVTRDHQMISQAERLVLPGVGAFASCMDKLVEFNLLTPLRTFFSRERPFLGICVGMQLMMAKGEEFGDHEGLDLIPGSVKAISRVTAQGEPQKVPHIGWNALLRPDGIDWRDSILGDTKEGENVYFVHSFSVVADQQDVVLANADYNGNMVTAAIRVGSFYGCQFHPEKSGPAGLKMINRFAHT